MKLKQKPHSQFLKPCLNSSYLDVGVKQAQRVNSSPNPAALDWFSIFPCDSSLSSVAAVHTSLSGTFFSSDSGCFPNSLCGLSYGFTQII